MLSRVLLVLVLAAAAIAVPVQTATASSNAARDSYRERVSRLEAKRTALAKRYASAKKEKSAKNRARVVRRARAEILRAIKNDFFPAWAKTAWNFNGTTTTPGEGTIACGYYVTTVLRDASFRVERARLAQQPSERIVKTLAPESSIWRFRKGNVRIVLDKIHELGDGLYVVGLDNHVGFLLEESGHKTQFCHASYYGKAEVLCEDALKSKIFESKYHVVGDVLATSAVVRWLEGRAFETVTE